MKIIPHFCFSDPHSSLSVNLLWMVRVGVRSREVSVGRGVTKLLKGAKIVFESKSGTFIKDQLLFNINNTEEK